MKIFSTRLPDDLIQKIKIKAATNNIKVQKLIQAILEDAFKGE